MSSLNGNKYVLVTLFVKPPSQQQIRQDLRIIGL